LNEKYDIYTAAEKAANVGRLMGVSKEGLSGKLGRDMTGVVASMLTGEQDYTPPLVQKSKAMATAGLPGVKGGRRRPKTRKIHRGGSTMPVDPALMAEMKIKYEKDLKKTGIDMRQKIAEIANELKSRPPYQDGGLLATLNAPDGLKNAKSMLEGFFMNVPEVPVTTRRSTDGGTRKKRRHTRRR
jgi:hypothetical protein